MLKLKRLPNLGEERRGAKPGGPGGPGRTPGTIERSLSETREMLRSIGCDPIKILGQFAVGDVVGLGLMTKEETEEPEVWGADRKGRPVLLKLSGKERARRMIDSKLREKAAQEVASYTSPKLSAATVTVEAPKGGCVLILPSNGREPKTGEEANVTAGG